MSFLKELASLLLTAVVRPILGLALFPVLALFYQPDAFGLLATLMALVALVGGVANLKLDYAITVADEADVPKLLGVGMFMSILMGLGVSIVCIFAIEQLDLPVAVAVGLGVAAFGCADCLRHANLRRQEISSVARAQLTQSIAEPLTQLAIALAFGGLFGLVYGYVAGLLVYATSLFIALRGRFELDFGVLVRQRRFLFYSFPASALNKLGTHAAMVAFGVIYGLEVMGAYALAQRVIGTPLFIVSNAVGQMYVSRAPNAPAPLTLYLRFLRWLVLGGLVLTVSAHEILLPVVLTLVDETWQENLQVVFWFAVLFGVQFTAVPVSQTLNLTGSQSWQFAWDAFRAVVVLGFFIFAYSQRVEALEAAKVYALAMAACYLVVMGLGALAAHREQTQS